jgi:alkyl sulfatase BDS1-like metallo-beta-lactamase superfamily hydrolase
VVTIYRKGAFQGTLPPRKGFRVTADALEVQAEPDQETVSTGLRAEAFFTELAKKVSADPSLATKVGVIYRFDVTGDGDQKERKSWLVDLKNAPGSITENSEGGDCIIQISDKHFVQLMNGKLNPQQAFMKGQLKIQGNMMLATKLSLLMSPSAAM